MTPLTMVTLCGLMNDYGSSSPSNVTVDKVNTQPRVKILIWEYIYIGRHLNLLLAQNVTNKLCCQGL